MSKKEDILLGKIKLMIVERMDILNNGFFNQKLESLNRRIEKVQCKKTHEEITKTFLKKISKLERCINAAIAFQEEAFSKTAVRQIMLPHADYQNTVLSQLRPSAFSPGIINIPASSSNTLLLSPFTGFTAAHVSEYISLEAKVCMHPLALLAYLSVTSGAILVTTCRVFLLCYIQLPAVGDQMSPFVLLLCCPMGFFCTSCSDEVILVSVENQNSATANFSAIRNNQISTQAEMSSTVQSEMKERKLKVIDLTEENHNCSEGRTEKIRNISRTNSSKPVYLN
ncbi:activating transcription factor 7-interacting protein 2 [Phalacrocorax aristotelis]|uniref:activating transcription factor 7-interacting protein 2 n=1 Tax=Phalacrocorax aristotelis TaxID=126867 RepID=UPI003F4B1F3D